MTHHGTSWASLPHAPRRLAALCAFALLAIGGTLLAGCGSGVDSRPQTARPAEDTHQDFGNFEVHYNAVRTDQLTPDVARAYDIERSGNRVMLNVSMLSKAPDGRTTPVDGSVRATAYNLNGQLKDLEMRRVQEGTSVYFIGEVGISGNEILVFDIDATPRDGSGAYSVKFKREFFAE
ncbi:MAG TPA: DUF4426 domain-containing protein [Steroidobacteraceae bacterium]|nr:DUF4426 domain-containing protein [Steroidobacteraceae bacterium]